jgi:UDP-N-acetylmuramoyl-L-alanyl-D-glutamate--2,6-diaminopimelate ligase
VKWNEVRDVLSSAGLATGDAVASSREIAGLAYDSRRVEPNRVFFALKGAHADGYAFAIDAVRRGASAVVSEQPAPSGVDIPWQVVTDARRALAAVSATFYRHPSAEMQVVGITGTNGKTTTAYLVASIFEAARIRCGLLGTVAYRAGHVTREATRTTPEALELQQMLREMVDAGCGACAMEVSSHALALHRVDGVSYAAAVFTNLTRDHLDFHGDMDAYFQAKRRLFEMVSTDSPRLINLDDPRGPSLVALGGRAVTYAVNRPADITPGALSFSLSGLSFDVRTPRGPIHVRSSLVGRPNVYNILAAVGTAAALGLSFDVIERGITALSGVPGRFQVVSNPNDEFTVVVDYAHTDDALRNLLETARPLTRGRVITVFGCGGDRDRTKRPLMGAVASRLSDIVVITSDNPRNEDPAAIIDDVRRGIPAETKLPSSQPRVYAIADRTEAVAKAIEVARPGDVVLLAGKGHEKYQVVGDRSIPYDDVAVAHEALIRRRSNSGVV